MLINGRGRPRFEQAHSVAARLGRRYRAILLFWCHDSRLPVQKPSQRRTGVPRRRKVTQRPQNQKQSPSAAPHPCTHTPANFQPDQPGGAARHRPPGRIYPNKALTDEPRCQWAAQRPASVRGVLEAAAVAAPVAGALGEGLASAIVGSSPLPGGTYGVAACAGEVTGEGTTLASTVM